MSLKKAKEKKAAKSVTGEKTRVKAASEGKRPWGGRGDAGKKRAKLAQEEPLGRLTVKAAVAARMAPSLAKRRRGVRMEHKSASCAFSAAVIGPGLHLASRGASHGDTVKAALGVIKGAGLRVSDLSSTALLQSGAQAGGANDEAGAIVLFAGGKPVSALMYLECHQRVDKQSGGHIYVERLATVKKHRRRRLASSLLQLLERKMHASAEKPRDITAHVVRSQESWYTGGKRGSHRVAGSCPQTLSRPGPLGTAMVRKRLVRELPGAGAAPAATRATIGELAQKLAKSFDGAHKGHACCVKPAGSRGSGLFATRDLNAGAIVAHCLVSTVAGTRRCSDAPRYAFAPDGHPTAWPVCEGITAGHVVLDCGAGGPGKPPAGDESLPITMFANEPIGTGTDDAARPNAELGAISMQASKLTGVRFLNWPTLLHGCEAARACCSGGRDHCQLWRRVRPSPLRMAAVMISMYMLRWRHEFSGFARQPD